MDGVSLGISVVSLAIQCLGGKKAVIGMITSSAKIKDINKRVRKSLFLREKDFKHCCQRLLKGLKSDEELKLIFGNGEAEAPAFWQDTSWESQLRAHLGDFFEEAMTAVDLCLAVFEQIHNVLGKCKSSKTGISVTETNGNGPEKNNDDLLSKESIPLFTKRRIAATETEIRTLLSELREHMDDYRCVVDKHHESRNGSVLISSTVPLKVPSKIKVDHSSIKHFQEQLNFLYAALASTGNCYCHEFNLRLEFKPIPEYSTATRSTEVGHGDQLDPIRQPVFNLLAIYGDHQSLWSREPLFGTESAFGSEMQIDDSFECGRYQLDALEVKPRLIIQHQLKDCSQTQNDERASTAKPKRKVTFTFETETVLGKRSSTIEKSVDGSKIISTKKIDNLCNCLATGNGHQNTDECLGYVPTQNNYLYYFYRAPKAKDVPKKGNMTLLHFLGIDDKDMRLPCQDRVRLALTLALSLLHLHSSSWIKQRWRSRDVLLFSENDENWAPYISAAFNGVHQGQIESTKTLKTSHIYSLGIILLEIGRSRPLLDHGKGKMRESHKDFDDEIREIYEAHCHIDRKTLSRELGAQYHEAVKCCIQWDREKDDLSNKDIQKAFCDNVVSKLEMALEAFSL